MARPTPTEIQHRVARLEAQLHQDQQAQQEVRDLLRQADERRKSDPGNERKWNKVLANLENGLDETKARINGCEVQLQAARRELAEFAGSVPGDTDAKSEGVPEAAAAANPDNYRRLAETIAETPLAQLGQFTLEQLAKVSRHVGVDLTPVTFPNFVRLVAHLEFANQQRAMAAPEEEGPERRKQMLLRGAIDKVLKQQIGNMTHEEMELVLASQELLVRNLRPGPRDDRLRQLLETGVAAIRRHLESPQ